MMDRYAAKHLVKTMHENHLYSILSESVQYIATLLITSDQ